MKVNHVRTFLKVVGVIGAATTAILAAKATKEFKEDVLDVETDLEPKDILEMALPYYKPAIISLVATTFIVGGGNIILKSYVLLDQAKKRSKTKEENYDKYLEPYEEAPVMIFYIDDYGKIFERTMLDVMNAEYELNRKFVVDGEATLNDFLELLDLRKIPSGDKIIWNMSSSNDTCLYAWIDFKHDFVPFCDDMECCVIEPVSKPIRITQK